MKTSGIKWQQTRHGVLLVTGLYEQSQLGLKGVLNCLLTGRDCLIGKFQCHPLELSLMHQDVMMGRKLVGKMLLVEEKSWSVSHKCQKLFIQFIYKKNSFDHTLTMIIITKKQIHTHRIPVKQKQTKKKFSSSFVTYTTNPQDTHDLKWVWQ